MSSSSPTTQTANGRFQYDQKFHEKTLAEWADDVHKEMSKASGWKYFPLQRGAFGFDNYVMSFGFTFEGIEKVKKSGTELTRDILADHIHIGWAENYIYWRDNLPATKDDRYKKPAKPLGDERRNMCAKTEYIDLPQDEKDKDLVIADFILKNLSK
jgi:hypothetical protein